MSPQFNIQNIGQNIGDLLQQQQYPQGKGLLFGQQPQYDLQYKLGGELQGQQLGGMQYQQYQYSLANPACKCGAHFRYVVNMLNMWCSWECDACGWYADISQLESQFQLVSPVDLFDHKIGAQAFWVDELGKWVK